MFFFFPLFRLFVRVILSQLFLSLFRIRSTSFYCGNVVQLLTKARNLKHASRKRGLCPSDRTRYNNFYIYFLVKY